MMIYPVPDKLDSIGSKYALVIVSAKRARQIKEDARKMVLSESANPLTVALEELAAGEITPVQVGGPEILPDTTPSPTYLGGFGTPEPEDGEGIDEDSEGMVGLLGDDDEIADALMSTSDVDAPIAETADGHPLYEVAGAEDDVIDTDGEADGDDSVALGDVDADALDEDEAGDTEDGDEE